MQKHIDSGFVPWLGQRRRWLFHSRVFSESVSQLLDGVLDSVRLVADDLRLPVRDDRRMAQPEVREVTQIRNTTTDMHYGHAGGNTAILP